MGARVTSAAAAAGSGVAAIEARMRAAGLEPRTFSNGPGERYAAHAHGQHKILLCLEGSITFQTEDGAHTLRPGDRLDLEPGTIHAATVHGDGVVCTEAYASGPSDLASDPRDAADD